MYHFFAPSENADNGVITITGSDVNHIINVLRLKKGERIVVADGQDRDSLCEIAEMGPGFVRCQVLPETLAETECPVRLHLFQGLPKGDKMETIIQKAVELGAASVIPVEMKRCVMKLDEKKKTSRTERWQRIAESAAKQSGRRIIPAVELPLTFKAAVEKAAVMGTILVPYENAENIAETRKLLASVPKGSDCAIFIGPEGGFDPAEIEALAAAGAHVITLGPRILRTETAGMAVLAMCTLMMEE